MSYITKLLNKKTVVLLFSIFPLLVAYSSELFFEVQSLRQSRAALSYCHCLRADAGRGLRLPQMMTQGPASGQRRRRFQGIDGQDRTACVQLDMLGCDSVFHQIIGGVMKHNAIATAVFGMVLTGSALAQTGMNRSQEKEAVGVVTEAGGTCERIVRTQTVGKLDDGTTLMAVACNGGDEERYVLQLDQRGNMTFYATCENLAKGTNNQVRCFA